MRELSTGRLDRLVIEVHDRHGSAAATTVRTVLSGMVGLAVRHDALRASLHEDEKCRDLDLVELTDVRLATGPRIGEATAVTWDALDLESGTVEVRGTVIRIKGSGDHACVPRTVATLMADAGLSARQAADQLGHSTISMAQDFYCGRTVAASGTKEVLEVFGTTSTPGTH
ncbi:hypothetical protein [Pseudonocardia alni]|uniref:hypothetical protein n=1 Tax=Pseudonocardia alni TaxID=33907 RepID=UPI0033301B01